MFKRQDTDSSKTKSNNPKELSPITAVIVGCFIGIILTFMIYTYVPKPAFIDRFLVWWFSGHHNLPPPSSTEGQEHISTTNLPTQNTDNHSRGDDDDDGIQNLPTIVNNNLNNNNIELTDLNTSTVPPSQPNTTITTR